MRLSLIVALIETFELERRWDLEEEDEEDEEEEDDED
jgi:hypothetical protein